MIFVIIRKFLFFSSVVSCHTILMKSMNTNLRAVSCCLLFPNLIQNGNLSRLHYWYMPQNLQLNMWSKVACPKFVLFST